MLVQKMREFKLFGNEESSNKIKKHNFQNDDEEANVSPLSKTQNHIRNSSVPGHNRNPTPSSCDLTVDFLN